SGALPRKAASPFPRCKLVLSSSILGSAYHLEKSTKGKLRWLPQVSCELHVVQNSNLWTSGPWDLRMYSDVSLMMSDGLGGKAASSMCRMILKHQLMMEESVRKLSDLIRLPRWNRAERKPLSEQPIRGDTAPR